MKSRIWRVAGVGLLCLSIGVPALAEGPQDPNGGGQGHGPQGQPQGQPQGGQQQRPQGMPQGQGRPQGQPGFQQQQHQQQQVQQQQIQQQQRIQQQQVQQREPQRELPIQGKPDAVRQTQEPVRGNWNDRRNDGNNHWQAGGPGNNNFNNNNRPHGNGWGPGPQYRPGQMIDRFPGRYDRVPWRGQDYFFSDGYWYRPQGPRYVVVAPPYGVRTHYLPDYAQQLWIGGALFFVAAGTYYQYMDNTQDYVVVNPPVDQPVVQQPQVIQQQIAQPAPSNGYDVNFYPANGQPPEQVAQDHYDCQRWAVQQSGFDPAVASYAPAPEVVSIYRQNMANCLVSRGYSVN